MKLKVKSVISKTRSTKAINVIINQIKIKNSMIVRFMRKRRRKQMHVACLHVKDLKREKVNALFQRIQLLLKKVS